MNKPNPPETRPTWCLDCAYRGHKQHTHKADLIADANVTVWAEQEPGGQPVLIVTRRGTDAELHIPLAAAESHAALLEFLGHTEDAKTLRYAIEAVTNYPAEPEIAPGEDWKPGDELTDRDGNTWTYVAVAPGVEPLAPAVIGAHDSVVRSLGVVVPVVGKLRKRGAK